jgi:hypothetical protein
MMYIGGMHTAYIVHSQTIFRQIITISFQTRVLPYIVTYLIFVFIPAFFKTRKCNTNLSSMHITEAETDNFFRRLSIA